MSSYFPGFLKTIILLGSIQGLILSSLLFFNKEKLPSNRFLGAMVFFLALACLNLWLQDQPWIINSTIGVLILNLVPMVVIMPVGPLFYFYTRAFTDMNFQLSTKEKRHFWPVILDFIPQLTTLIYILGLAFHIIAKNDGPWGNFIDTYNVYSDIPRWLSLTSYVFLTFRYLKKNNIHLNWCNQMLIALSIFQIIWLVYLVPYIIPSYTDRLLNGVGWFPIYIPLVILIYWLGIKGYLQWRLRPTAAVESAQKSIVLDEAVVQRTAAALNEAMEIKKLFLEPTLDLSSLAAQIDISPKIISAVLNQHLKVSFTGYVNGYRIGAVKKRLALLKNEHLSIVGIAYECGFNSQPTFQRAFKSIVGITPKEFIATQNLEDSKNY